MWYNGMNVYGILSIENKVKNTWNESLQIKTYNV